MKFKKIGFMLLVFATFLSIGDKAIKSQFSPDLKGANPLERTDSQFFGYGYSALEKYPIYDGINAYHYANPILDVNNSDTLNILEASLVRKDVTEQNWVGNTSRVLSEVAREYGTNFGGGLGAKLSVVNLDVNAHFDKTCKFGTVAYEEYQFYSAVIKNRIINTTLTVDQLRNYLSPNFKRALFEATTEEKAKSLFSTFGTHLFQGYALGGVMEATNYFASKSMALERKQNQALKAQFEAAASNYGGGIDFSFESTFGSVDNTDSSVSNYRAAFYGGKGSGGFSIDQLFQLVGDNLGSNTKYRYEDWIDSLYKMDYSDSTSTNPTISGIPNDLKPIPVWDFLPNTSTYNKIRNNLYSTYANLSQKIYQDYIASNPDKTRSYLREDNPFDINLPELEDIDVQTYEPNSKTSFYQYNLKNNDDNTFYVKSGSRLTFNYNEDDFVGLNLEWKPQNNINDIKVLDARNGIFEISQYSGGIKFTIAPTVDGAKISGAKNIIIYSMDDYFVGSGSIDQPYEIQSKEDFKVLADNSNLWDKHYVLSDDITFDYQDGPICIGTQETPFTGTFDGQCHKLINVKVGVNDKSMGLFAFNDGTIKNLSFETSGSTSNKLSNYTSVGDDFAIYDSNETINEEIKKYNFKLFKPNATNVTDVLYAGILVGKASSNSHIENISVSNHQLLINSGINNKIRGNTSKTVTDVLSVGGLIGKNEGSIKICSIDKSMIEGVGYNFLSINVGGLVGLQENSNNTKKIEGVSISNTPVFGYLGDVSTYGHKDISLYVGGAFGYLNGSQVNELFINFTNLTDGNYSSRNGITSMVFGTNQLTYPSRANARAGGIAGYFNNGSINEAIIKGGSINTVKALEGGDVNPNGPQDANKTLICQGSNYYKYEGFICGDYNANSVISEQFKNVYFDALDDVGYYKNTVKTLSGVVKSDAPTNILSNYFNVLVGINNRKINHSSIDENSIYLDTSEVKKVFYIGDEFQSNGLRVFFKTTTNKTEEELRTYKIDISQFNNDVEGTCEIRVIAFGKVLSYSVQVVDPKGSHLEVEYTGTKSFYEGEKFDDFENLSVFYVKENGTKVELSKEDYTLNSKPFVKGYNDVEVHYVDKFNEEFNFIFSVEAFKKSVVKYEILSVPSKTTFEVNYSLDNDDLAGLTAKVYYQDENGLEKSYIETNIKLFEILNPTIGVGENTIYLIYDAYFLATFNVTGTYNTQSAITRLESIINNIEKTNNIDERRILIDEGQELLPYINISISENAAAIVSKFNNLVDKYNLLLNLFNQVSTISNSFKNLTLEEQIDKLIEFINTKELVGEYTSSGYEVNKKNLDTEIEEFKTIFINKVNELCNETDFNKKASLIDEILIYIPLIEALDDSAANVALKKFNDCKNQFEIENENIITEFVDLVNSISTKKDLYDKFITIKKALALKEEYGEISDKRFESACKVLEQEIANYNKIIENINSDIETNIEVSNTFIGSATTLVGLSVLAIIAALLKKFII